MRITLLQRSKLLMLAYFPSNFSDPFGFLNFDFLVCGIFFFPRINLRKFYHFTKARKMIKVYINLAIQLKFYPTHATNYMHANEPKFKSMINNFLIMRTSFFNNRLLFVWKKDSVCLLLWFVFYILFLLQLMFI